MHIHTSIPDPNHVRIQIIDNGGGIPEGIVHKVFDPFFTTKDPDKGTGLGLSISKSIVEEFGGTLNLTPDSENQTIATIQMPVHQSPV